GKPILSCQSKKQVKTKAHIRRITEMDSVLKPIAREQKLQQEAKVRILIAVDIQGPRLDILSD
ncbi:hypothetical protein PS027_23580, partial [Shigella sonnei]|nr:hypothetical protein [Shigella sonnei]